MGWGWFSWSSSSSPSPPKGPEAPATPSPLQQNANLEQDARKLALLDYQTQLMLLEEQNRERLWRARQEQEEGRQGAQKLSSMPLVAQPTSSSEPQRTPQEQFRRGAKQLGLFFAGAGFLTASALIARRAVARKMVDSIPKFYHPSHHGPRPPPRGPKEKSDDQLVAVEALGLATLNVFSFGVMMTGGLMFAFDISNVEELRRKARRSLYGTNGVVDEAAEQQVEEWIADVLSRKDKRDGEEDVQKRD